MASNLNHITSDGVDYPLIDIMKFILSIIVVAIHTEPFDGTIVGNMGCYKLVTNIAVPFFFVASGFLYRKKFETGGQFIKIEGFVKDIFSKI